MNSIKLNVQKNRLFESIDKICYTCIQAKELSELPQLLNESALQRCKRSVDDYIDKLEHALKNCCFKSLKQEKINAMIAFRSTLDHLPTRNPIEIIAIIESTFPNVRQGNPSRADHLLNDIIRDITPAVIPASTYD